ncbi:MAG: hypothetical protein Q8T09_12780 [Candidatus Melainabacteria bacterium]|nr:hypothetical protein [Candidatus Melainabacteria bacterium]
MSGNLLLIFFLRFLAAFISAWIGIIIGLLAPFQVAPTQPLTLLNPILPASFLFMGLCSTFLTACVAGLAVFVFALFVIMYKLPWWLCAVIIAAFAAVSYTVKTAWAS